MSRDFSALNRADAMTERWKFPELNSIEIYISNYIHTYSNCPHIHIQFVFVHFPSEIDGAADNLCNPLTELAAGKFQNRFTAHRFTR